MAWISIIVEFLFAAPSNGPHSSDDLLPPNKITPHVGAPSLQIKYYRSNPKKEFEISSAQFGSDKNITIELTDFNCV